MVLPVACMTYYTLAVLSRYMRSGMLEAIRQDFIRTARAKGLSERLVIYRHALRNSLIPIITLMADVLPALIGGSIVIETLFSIPGMGALSYDAVLNGLSVADGSLYYQCVIDACRHSSRRLLTLMIRESRMKTNSGLKDSGAASGSGFEKITSPLPV
jgi:ABC-type microcin C transport system permease subunit YejB